MCGNTFFPHNSLTKKYAFSQTLSEELSNAMSYA